MAILVSVPKRGTDLKANLKEAIRIKTKKLQWFLIGSLIVNCILTYIIFRK